MPEGPDLPRTSGAGSASLAAFNWAVAHGQADTYLESHPDLVTSAVAEDLVSGCRRALRFGDLEAAALAAAGAGAVLRRLGMPRDAAEVQAVVIEYRVARSAHPEDLEWIRSEALALVTAAQSADWKVLECRGWITAVRAASARSRSGPAPRKIGWMLTTLRDLSDLMDVLGDALSEGMADGEARTAAQLVTEVVLTTRNVDWPTWHQLETRALYGRLARVTAALAGTPALAELVSSSQGREAFQLIRTRAGVRR